MPDEAQLNIDMDNKCDTGCHKGEQLTARPLKGSGAMLLINGRYITTSYPEHTRGDYEQKTQTVLH